MFVRGMCMLRYSIFKVNVLFFREWDIIQRYYYVLISLGLTYVEEN